MKRIISCIAAIALLFLFPCSFAGAENKIPNIDVTAVLNKDGSANITQVWSGSFDEGTECYFEFIPNASGKPENLTVSDSKGKYETLSNWDIDANFDEKARKCGLHKTDSGYEVCWGISEYGSNTYTVTFNINEMVGAFDNSDGFNFRFINSGMNTTPTTGSIKIVLADGTPITDENCNIWAFGYEGDVQFSSDGSIVAKTSTDLSSDNHMTIMAEFNKGIFVPARISEDSFETVKDKAFDGSDYETDDDTDIFVVFCIFAVVAAIVLITVGVIEIRKRVKLKKFTRSVGYFRDNPNDGNLNATYVIGKAFKECREGSIIGARILKLIMLGYLEPLNEQKVGFMGNTKTETNLRLASRPKGEIDDEDKRLYQILLEAAGEDGILQQKEMEKYCAKDPKPLRHFLDDCEALGNNYAHQKRLSKGPLSYNINKLTAAGKAELGQLLGYKKYLLDFSLISEREISETVVWQDMMVYGSLLSVADRVAEQLRKVYPQYIPEIEQFQSNTFIAYGYYSCMYSAMRQREMELEAARSGGSGGFSSIGGGGGFSGGGFSGGTR